MDISDLVTDEYARFDPDTSVSKLVGTFDESAIRGVLVVDDTVKGIVTRRQLATSHRQPNQKLSSVTQSVPRVTKNEDVREVARLMVHSDSHILPVFDDETLLGVVTAERILEAVCEYLDAINVSDIYSADLVSVEPHSTFGEVLNLFRERRIAHLPVVDTDRPVGILSLYDVTGTVIRAMHQSQGGDAGGVDAFGADISDSAANTRRGGFGAREGEAARMLEIPVRDLMVEPVETIESSETVRTAVERMLEMNAASLVVMDNGHVDGIVTSTDVLDALTWEATGQRGVQVYGIDLLDDMSHEEVVAMIDRFDDRDHGMRIHDAKIHLHEHDETMRGTRLVLARVRVFTDKGIIMAEGEGFGASQALNEARDALERQVRDRKTHGRTKKKPDEEFWEKRFGWWLEA